MHRQLVSMLSHVFVDVSECCKACLFFVGVLRLAVSKLQDAKRFYLAIKHSSSGVFKQSIFVCGHRSELTTVG